MASSAYATPADLQGYLPDSSLPVNTTFYQMLLNVCSRFIDMKCGQYFYQDGRQTRYFDGEGLSHIDTGSHPFYPGPEGVSVQLAYYENQPLNQWVVTLTGDGKTPPSNFFMWPRNRPNAGSSADPTQIKPYYGLDIARIPISGTTYLPSSIPGYLTVSVTAYWGWPVVPDVLKDLTCKLAARLWRAKESGWTETIGSSEINVTHVMEHFDPMDEFTLVASDLVLTYF